MRSWWLIPLSLAAMAGIGTAALSAAGKPMAVAAMLAAVAVAAAGSAAAVVPMKLVAPGDLPGISQAGLVGTVLHLFTALALAGAVFVLGLARNPQAFAGWLLAMYLASLAAVVVVLAGAVREASASLTARRDGDQAR